MAKALKTIGIVVGAAALIATGIGAAVGTGALLGVAGSTFTAIGGIAGLVSGVANIGAGLLTKPPPARGSITETVIDVEPPSAYGMGEGYFAGVLRARIGYGATTNDVPNPYLFEALALCAAGPIEGPITPKVDFGNIDSWYNGFLAYDTRLGARPETALVPPFDPGAPGWTSNHRLSSVAQIGWGHRFDEDGERFASGVPTRGVEAKWVKVYDPRQDSTQPGGDGPCRLGDETTYVWDGPAGATIPAGENPALHAGTYGFGRYVNGTRVMGIGLPEEGIDWEGVAAWANDCEANNWRMFGFVFEGDNTTPAQRWANLIDICIAGGGQPLFAGAVLGFHWNRPRVPLDTVTRDDLVAEGLQEVTAQQSWRDRLNTIVPKYMEPTRNWSLIDGERVQVASYLTEDGEEKSQSVPFNFVKDAAQAAQLAAYWLVNGRELSPITLTVMPRLRGYRPGECLRLEIAELGLDHDAVILRRELDPATMTTKLTLITEDPTKHPFALGLTATAPATPAIGQTAQERDQTAAVNQDPKGLGTLTIAPSYTRDLAGNVSQSENGDGTVDVSVPAHTRVYGNGTEVAVNAGTITVPESNDILIYYDDALRSGGAVSYQFVNITAGGTAGDAYFSETNPNRHFIASVTSVDSSGAGGSSGGSSPPGGGGWEGTPGTSIP
ncbi:MAG: hypothetical protein AAF650_04920 [Pseudomonadota bacterium]